MPALQHAVIGTGESELNSRTGRIRVLQIAAPAPVGGLETVVQGLSVGLHQRNVDVRVLAVIAEGSADHPFLAPLRAAGVPFDLVRVPGGSPIRELREVARVVGAFRPHVVHTHGYRSDLLHSIPAVIRRIPRVSTLHGSSRLGGSTHLFEWIQERALRRFQGVIAVSRPLGQSLIDVGIDERRLEVIPNAWLPTSRPLDRSEARLAFDLGDEFTIGWVGRLIEAKAPDRFVEALGTIRDLPWKAVMIGDGRMRNLVDARIDQLGLGDRVLRIRDEPAAGRMFAAFDVFLLPSRTEGTPIVLFEAISAGVPVVASRVGGVPDVVGEGEALLVDASEPERTGAAVRAVFTDRASAVERAGRAARRLEKSFGADRWIDRHLELYGALASSGGVS